MAAKRPAPLAAQKGVTVPAIGASNPEPKGIHPEMGLVLSFADCRFNSFFHRDKFAATPKAGDAAPSFAGRDQDGKIAHVTNAGNPKINFNEMKDTIAGLKKN